ncbi:MAG TPA: hypothetical protein VGS22_26035 [Thermoanaerobaculia bacterium]|jgi:hypothetical protein|nr:hypothetical protein [Thermoanaerobaculia bacterium]
MITGYNTDVRHNDVVFHVQTEDKGAGNPQIESLVYVSGQVLVSKKASYASLLAEGHGEKAILALMDQQHRTMIAAIRHGKLDDKWAAMSAARGGNTSVKVPIVRPPRFDDERAEETRNGPIRGDATMAPERSLDQVILEYLTHEADQEQLVVTLEGERDLTIGQAASLMLRASSSKSGQPVTGAQVTVKMISTVAEPRMLAMGQSDDFGMVALRFDIPSLGRGTAALIVSAVSAIGRAELKHLL